MNAKNKVIEKLLIVAKKHKVLTYPALALVAVISFFSYFFSWSHGAGKRIIAVIMVMVMLVSQSYFLTTSATTSEDTEKEIEEQLTLQKEHTDEISSEAENLLVTEETSTETATQESNLTSEQGTTVSNEEITTDTEQATEAESKAPATEPVADNSTGAKADDSQDAGTKTKTIDYTLICYTRVNNALIYGEERSVSGSASVSYREENGAFVYDLSGINVQSVLSGWTGNGCYEIEPKWYYEGGGGTEADLKNVMASGDQITLFCYRDMKNYNVSISGGSGNGASYTVSDGEKSEDNVTGFLLPVGKTMTITNITRTGYDFAGVTAQDSQIIVTNDIANQSAAISVTGKEPNRQITFNWTKQKYNIQYSKDKDGTSGFVTQQVTYDGEDTFYSGSDVEVVPEKGYKFIGWKIGQGADAVSVKPGELVTLQQDKLYNQTITIYPEYDYDELKLDTSAVTYTYKQPEAPKRIRVSYANGEADMIGGNFTYQITSGADQLRSIGINADAVEGGISITTSGPTAVTADSIPLVFTVTDQNVPDRTKNFTVNISVKKRVITIQPPTDEKSVEKTYDGTVQAPLKVTTLNTDVPGVTLTFQTAEYETADVGEEKRILLSDPTVDWGTESANRGNYEFATVGSQYYLIGKITPRPVYVKTRAEFTNGRDYVRTGEKNPVLIVEEDKDNQRDGTGFLNGATIENQGITASTKRQDGSTEKGTYAIEAVFPEGSNYQAAYIDKSALGEFEVIEEEPKKGGNYRITGTKGNDDWYIETPAKALPIDGSGYNEIRISKDGSTVYRSGSTVDLREEDFAKGSNLYIQLYDSTTGAVTGWKKINVKVDETAPEYIGYKLSQGDDILYDETPIENGLYFPTKGMLTFGSYFNRTVKVTVTYRDTTSGLSSLSYGLYGEPAGTRAAFFTPKDEDGYATATFEIYQMDTEKAGKINFYAEDIAGNKGEGYDLKRGEASDWSVELSGPVIESFYVTTGESQQEYTGGKEYYSNCTAVVKVSDKVSGIHSIAWDVNGTRYPEERVGDTEAKQTTWSFQTPVNQTTFPSTNGDYSIYAVIADNAGNEVTTNTISLKVDDEPPIINVTSYDGSWQTKAQVKFNASDTLSGVDYIKVLGPDGSQIAHQEEEKNNIYYCSFEITQKGNYSIIVADKAGNTTTKEIVSDKVSSEVPECPDITIHPEKEADEEWYRETPSVTIENITRTPTDDTPVTTKYQLTKQDGTAVDVTEIPQSEPSAVIEVPDGIYTLKAWSQSMTGVRCANTHEYRMKVDTVLPKITYTTRGSGSSILVNFTVTDDGSGVDGSTLKVLCGTKEFPAKIEKRGSGYTGSFVISERGSYSIQASDIAGNAAEEASFSPMSMSVNAIKNISVNSVALGANVIKGTFDIRGTSISYKKVTDSRYLEAESITNRDSNGNIAISAVLTGLSEGTVYAYKVRAVSAVNEVLEYEGYFKTLSTAETGAPVTGMARYADGRAGNVTVGLFKGNVCIRALEISAGDEFTFQNVPDGNYSIVATDGSYSSTKRVLIKDGVIVYPEHYIDLILSGKNTSVVITTTDTPDITADNMDSIFDYDVINYTDDDMKLIQNGGIVEFKLYATLMSVANVSANEISAMYNVTDQSKIVGAYLDLSLYKVVTDNNGEVTRSRVTELANGANVSVTIPLGELSGKSGLEVIRIHDTGDGNYLGASLQDQDNNPATYTVTTNQFSTYAVLYNRESAPTTEDKKTDDRKDNPTTEQKKPNDGKDNPTTEDKKPNDGKDNPAKGGTNGSTIGSLRSSGTAKTGDETPIAVMGTMMLLSAAGFFTLKRKTKQERIDK